MDHKHEYIIYWGNGKGIIKCHKKDCGHEISSSEAVRRLNATECLSPEIAVATSYLFWMCDGIVDDLVSYAKTLDETINTETENKK